MPPSPPITMTISVGIRICSPMSGVTLSSGAATAPARPASAQPTQKTMKNSLSTLMPRQAAMASLSTPARIIAPIWVRPSTKASAANIARPSAMMNSG